MSGISEKINQYLETAEKAYHVPRRWLTAIIIFPLFIELVMLVLLRLRTTREATRWMLAENHPVELLTFLFLLIAGCVGIVFAWRCIRNHEVIWVSGFYLLFSVCLLLVAMEEISWGQQLFKFETFGAFREINQQGEVNLHNIGSLQGNSAYFRIVYGLGGVFGVWLFARNMWIWRKITPPEMLLTWFLAITFFAALGIYKNLSGDTTLYYAFSLRHLSELNEMLIGLSSLLFIWLNMRRFNIALRRTGLPLTRFGSLGTLQ